MNRHERRAQKATMNNNEYIRNLENSNRNQANYIAALERNITEKDETVRQQALLLSQPGKIELHIDPNMADDSGVLIPAQNVLDRVEGVKRQYQADIDLAFAIMELILLCQKVDLLAVESDRTKLAMKLEKQDETLMAALQGVRREASNAHYTDEALLGSLAADAEARINAIMQINRDNGKELRRVVAEASNEYSEQAKALIQKLRDGARQGRHVEPLTERVHDYAKVLKYDENRTWQDAGKALEDDLFKRGANLDELDQIIWNDIKVLSIEKRWQYMHSKYWSYENQMKEGV